MVTNRDKSRFSVYHAGHKVDHDRYALLRSGVVSAPSVLAERVEETALYFEVAVYTNREFARGM
jgi:hypothetical protein